MSWGRGCGRSPGLAVLLGSGSLQQQKVLEDDDAALQLAVETCNTNCQLIASQAEHLHRMRSRCATTAQLTQQEIRNVEEKLVKLFSMQLVTKHKLPLGTLIPPELQLYPSLRQWLEVVGLSKEVIDGLCSDVLNLENLLEREDCELNSLLCKHGADTWEIRKLLQSVGNLRRYSESQLQGKEEEFSGSLFWDSWVHSGSTSSSSFSSLSRTSHRAQRSSVSSSEGEGGSVGGTEGGCGVLNGSYTSSGIGLSQRSSDDSNPSSPPLTYPTLPPPSPGVTSYSAGSTLTLPHCGGTFQERRYTPPPTPPVMKGNKSSGDRKFPPTPPPNKKNMLQNAIKQQQQQQQQQIQAQQQQQQPSLGRSTSHESQLSHRLDHEIGTVMKSPNVSPLNTHFFRSPRFTRPFLWGSMDQLMPRRTRLQSDSGAETVMSTEVSRSPDGGSIFYRDIRDCNRNMGSCGDFNDESRIIPNSPLSSKLASPTKIPYHTEADEDKYGDKYGDKNTLSVPKLSKLNISGSMGHNVHHRFTIALKPDKCGYCHQKIPLFGGLKCKECSFKCHRECESKIAPSCGLPEELLALFTAKVQSDFEHSGKISNHGISNYNHPHLNDCLPKGGISSSQMTINSIPTFLTQDSSSNTSSCNSSTPSSPALIMQHSPAHKSTFNYSDISICKLHQLPEIPVDMRPWVQYEPKPPPTPLSSSQNSNVIDSRQSHDSDRTVSTTSGSGSTGTDDSERTVAGRVDSQDSTVSEGESNDPRCTRQNSVSSVSQSLREWDIPYDELVHEEIVGKGRFGTVYSGNWHGQVAIKELHMDYVNDEKTLEAFKIEHTDQRCWLPGDSRVAQLKKLSFTCIEKITRDPAQISLKGVSTFRKTRHENLVLFMGACMKPPRLAIVTSLCKGMTLYRHIHIRKDKFTMSRTIPIAQQIAQGMGYLHARGIVHKDLKTKNIFLENGKVIITDFGLFNVTRLCDSRRGDWLSIPPGWLCYLSPEIMRSLRLNPKPEDGLPFTTYSDVYSFGTVWYELLCGEWPHKGQPPEAVIWQVGRGMKPSLAHLQASRDVKDILMACWSYHSDERREFSVLLQLLTRLPKKRLARSPSHPVQLSRSAESVF